MLRGRVIFVPLDEVPSELIVACDSPVPCSAGELAAPSAGNVNGLGCVIVKFTGADGPVFPNVGTAVIGTIPGAFSRPLGTDAYAMLLLMGIVSSADPFQLIFTLYRLLPWTIMYSLKSPAIAVFGESDAIDGTPG